MTLTILCAPSLATRLRAIAENADIAAGAVFRWAMAWHAANEGRPLPAIDIEHRGYRQSARARFSVALPPEWSTVPGITWLPTWREALKAWLAAGAPVGEMRRRVPATPPPPRVRTRKPKPVDARLVEFLAEDPESRWPSGKSAADVRPGRITGRPTIHDPTEPTPRNHGVGPATSERLLAELRRRGEPVDVPTLAMALDVSQSTIRGSLYRLIDAGAVTTPDVLRRALRVGGNRVYEATP